MKPNGTAQTSRLWRLMIDVTLQADDAAEAAQMAEEITGGTLDHEAVWAASGDFDPEQPTETVDV